MEELATLQYGNFTILGEWAKEFTKRTSCSNRVASRVNFFSMSYDQNTWAGVPPTNKSGFFSCWSAYSTTLPPWGENSTKGTPEHCKQRWPSDGPWASLHLDPFRVHRYRNTKDCWAYLLGGVHSGAQCAPSLMAWRVYEGAVLRSYQTVRPGLAYRANMGQLGPMQEAGDAPTAVQPHGPIPPQLGLGGGVSQVTEGRPLNRLSGLRSWHSQSRDMSRQCQSSLPWWPSRCQSPSPSPPWSHPTNEQLSCSLKDLHLQPR